MMWSRLSWRRPGGRGPPAGLHKCVPLLDSDTKPRHPEDQLDGLGRSARIPQVFLEMADATRAAADAMPSARILEAVRYLDQCRVARRLFAVVTGPDAATRRRAVDAFVGALPGACRLARLPAPTDSEHVFLQAILAQLGFEPFESTADDLQRLLLVVLRQGAARRAPTVIVVEDAQDFGPRVLEALRELARNAAELDSPPLLVLTGHAGLNRVLDSRGLASVAAWTAARFDMAAQPVAEPAPPPTPAVHVVLSLNGDVVRQVAFDRPRMLIGRSEYCDIHIPSRFVSRQHALLVRNADGDWLIDLKSTNGTGVNSQLVEHRQLGDGDIISIGNHRLKYCNPAAARVAPRQPARDRLDETVVMRSLQALRVPRGDDPPSGSTSSSAA